MMARNKNWWDKLDRQRRREVDLHADQVATRTRVAALLSGDVDLLTDLPTQDVDRLRADPKLKVVDGPEVRTIFLALDVGSAELKYSQRQGQEPVQGQDACARR